MLRLRLLGELEVYRDDERLALPPSRKTRALLGYLVAVGRSHRRERLCSMFWDVPDDPRGSLRWSMSRLRSVVDAKGDTRISADRESVRLDTAGADVDLLTLRAAVAAGFGTLATEELTQIAELFRGEFLEGLELPNQHEFQTWCLAEREDLRQQQIKLLEVLVRRLADTPEAALRPLRQLTQVDPYNEGARLDLLRALMAAGREQEAERQFEAAERQFRELGNDVVARLTRQWRQLRQRQVAAAPEIETNIVHTVRTIGTPQPALASIGRSALVGREAELRRIQAGMETARRLREAGAALVLAEPGMGKSRLIAEVTSRAAEAGMRVFSGRAYDGALGAAYAPWIEALKRLPDLSATETQSAGREKLFGAVIDVIVGDGDTPVLVALDDMHWSDEASADLLHQLIRAARQTPLTVVIGARMGELADNAPMTAVLRGLKRDGLIDEIRLAPLAPAMMATLVGSIAPAAEVERIRSLSGGNPLFAIELARDLGAHGDMLPSSLRELLRERVERLPQSGAELLRWAAVLGASFPVTRLQTVAGLQTPDFLQSLDLVERYGVLRPSEGESYAFAHDLIRQAVLTTLSGPRRKLMHLRIAESLDTPDLDEALALELANHAAAGGNHAMAARACAAAGRRALRVFAHVEALALVRAGQHYAESLNETERIERLVDLMEVEVSADRDADRGELIGRLTGLAEAALDAGRPELASRCYTTLAHLRWQQGHWQAAKRDTLQAEFISRVSGTSERVIAMAEAARCLAMLERDMEHAEALALEAEALARRIALEPNAIPDALGLLRAHQGHVEEAEQLFQRARDLARRDGDRLNEFLVLEHHVMLKLSSGGAESLRRLCGDLVDLAGKLRPGSETAFAEALLALSELRAGDRRAAGRIEAALEKLRRADAKHRLAVAATAAAWAFLEVGGEAEAERLAAEALDSAERLERASDIAQALAVLIQIARHRKDSTQTRRYRERLAALSSHGVSAGAREATVKAIEGAGLR